MGKARFSSHVSTINKTIYHNRLKAEENMNENLAVSIKPDIKDTWKTYANTQLFL